jgi:prepilin-type processing-associated H-X9-DG protein
MDDQRFLETVDTEPTPKPVRFSLSAMFAAIGLLGVTFGIARIFGYGWAVLLIVVATFTFAAGEGTARRRAVRAGLATVAVLVVALLFVPAINSPRSGYRPSCQNNLRQIALALLQYKYEKGHFPPAYIADKNGKPMHSWRVLILPYLERKDIYDAYNFDEPWDGPNNRKLAKIYLDLFRCHPSDDDRSPTTDYVAVVGPGTLWDPNANGNLQVAEDGLAETILLAEVADSGIRWMEPRDLYLGQMSRTINPKAGQGISSKHHSGANVAFADGRISLLLNNLKPEILDSLLSRNGGESIPPEDEWLSDK